MNLRRAAACGFTLLEVLIALAVLALALTALVRAAGQQSELLGHARALTLATWTASDVLSELRLRDRFPPAGRRSGRAEQGGRPLRWELLVSATEQPAVRRIEVAVFDADAPPDSAPLTRLTGFAGQP